MFESVRHLSQNIHASGKAEVKVVGLSDGKTCEDIHAWAPVGAKAHSVRGPTLFGYAPTMRDDLIAINPNIVHMHGLWKYPSIVVSSWARQTHRPYVISPRGMLEPWALQRSALRKQLARRLFQDASLTNAACIHATSVMETRSVRSAGFNNPIAMIPNGVTIPSKLPVRSNGIGRIKQALFLSRIHPKKGLLNLIRAWAELKPTGWQLLIVGPDEENHLRDVEIEVQKYAVEDSVIFRGEVIGDEKWQVYSESDLFVLPSFSENFGIAIAEALGCGVPVITTQATPWEDITRHESGWWIDVGLEPLISALKEATSLPLSELRKMGTRGRELIQEQYSWMRIAEQMVEVYEWVIGGRRRPDCVVAD